MPVGDLQRLLLRDSSPPGTPLLLPWGERGSLRGLGAPLALLKTTRAYGQLYPEERVRLPAFAPSLLLQ